jgi:hypothetical protein
VLNGVAIGRLNMELRGAQLAVRMTQSEELRESSRALLAQSQHVCDQVVARRGTLPRVRGSSSPDAAADV